MDNMKRERRKAAKQRRRQELAKRHVTSTATITAYGTDGRVHYTGVVVHRGSQVLASQVFDTADFASVEQAAAAAVGWARAAGAGECFIVDGLQRITRCEHGHLVLDVADRPPEDVN
jgi:hypothetical protein